MYAIILFLTVAFLFFIRRILIIRKSILEMEEEFKITLNFPAAFYGEQAFSLFAAIIWILALDPIPAILAIALVFGVFIDLIVSAIHFSLPKYASRKSRLERGDSIGSYR